MNDIKLSVVSTTSSGSMHVQILINEEDCGIMYLSETEYSLIDKIMKRGTMELEYSYTGIESDQDEV